MEKPWYHIFYIKSPILKILIGIASVVLAGGCFLNRMLSTALVRRLTEAGLRVHEARCLPPNDGGLSLGQAWLAIAAQGTHTQGRRECFRPLREETGAASISGRALGKHPGRP